MSAIHTSEVIEIDAADVTHLPDDGVVPPVASAMPGRETVQAHPFLAVGAAIAAGYVIGRAMKGV